MPYIPQIDRAELEVNFDADGITAYVHTTGELNYIITRICHTFIERRGKRYTTINEVIGALECAKLELYRRVAAPYEDTKIAENGDMP